MNLATAQQSGSSLLTFLPLVLIAAAVYFLMIRPQSRKRREVEAMQRKLGQGDEIVTVGGLYGTVTALDDQTVTLEISPGVTARYAVGAIARVVTRATDEAEATDVTPSAIENTTAE